MAKKPNLSPESAPSRVTSSSKASKPAPKHQKAKSAAPSTPSNPVGQPAVPTFTITREDIATLAFSYWERRGYQGGSSQEDWDRAERELRSLLG